MSYRRRLPRQLITRRSLLAGTAAAGAATILSPKIPVGRAAPGRSVAVFTASILFKCYGNLWCRQQLACGEAGEHFLKMSCPAA